MPSKPRTPGSPRKLDVARWIAIAALFAAYVLTNAEPLFYLALVLAVAPLMAKALTTRNGPDR